MRCLFDSDMKCLRGANVARPKKISEGNWEGCEGGSGKWGDGDPGLIRTADTQFRKLLLYPSELRGHCFIIAGVSKYWSRSDAPSGAGHPSYGGQGFIMSTIAARAIFVTRQHASIRPFTGTGCLRGFASDISAGTGMRQRLKIWRGPRNSR